MTSSGPNMRVCCGLPDVPTLRVASVRLGTTASTLTLSPEFASSLAIFCDTVSSAGLTVSHPDNVASLSLFFRAASRFSCSSSVFLRSSHSARVFSAFSRAIAASARHCETWRLYSSCHESSRPVLGSEDGAGVTLDTGASTEEVCSAEESTGSGAGAGAESGSRVKDVTRADLLQR